jgi:hypothetical protein
MWRWIANAGAPMDCSLQWRWIGLLVMAVALPGGILPTEVLAEGERLVLDTGVGLAESQECDRPLVYQFGRAAHVDPRPRVYQVGRPRTVWHGDETIYVGPRPSGAVCDETGPDFEPTGCEETGCSDPACPSCGPIPGPIGEGLGRFVDSIGWYGWLSQGFTWNPDSPADRFNGPLTFNDRSNEYQMNQLYSVLERPVCADGCAWDIGGRVDLLYGTDYFFVTALGLETHPDGTPRWNSDSGPRGDGASLYGLAMPQAYAEVYAPAGYGLSAKLGHFYSILGYESAMDPENFFYSRSYARQYGEPFTHTGFIAEYGLTPALRILGGLTRGWDTWEDPNDAGGFLGGATWSCPDGVSAVSFAIHTGNEDPQGDQNRTVYTLVYERQLSRCCSYALEHVYGDESDAAFDNDQPTDARWYGIAQYLYWQCCPTTSLGLRAEWFRDRDNARVLGIPFDSLSEGGDYVEVSLGLRWEPCPRVLMRSEVRWDWSDVEAPQLDVLGMFDDFQDENQVTVATNLILRY